MTGITDASATYSPSTPRTRRSGPTTASGPVPIAAVPHGWHNVEQFALTNASFSARESRPGGIADPAIRLR